MWWKSFEQTGRQSWEALVPGYNYFVAFKVMCHKPFWSLLLLFPGVHLVMLASLNVSYIRRFGYFSFTDTLQGIFFPYLIFSKIAQSKQDFLPETNWSNSRETEIRKWGDHIVLFLCLPVIGHVIALGLGAVTREKPGKKSKVKEWGDSLLFALVAASIIRTYVFEPFQIPTGSMEKTLLVGDFLFVNKLAYGPKVPVTPLSYPLVHNTVPWVNIKSYTTLEKGRYTRLPGFGKVNQYDVVVFNYPSGDTAVYDPRMPNGLMGHDYYGIINDEAKRLFDEENSWKLNDKIQQLINKSDLSDSIKQEYLIQYQNEFYHNFILQLPFWQDRARFEISERKRTWSGNEGIFVEHYGIIYRPVDKRENYIKRCVAVAGQFIEIKNAVLYVNDKKAKVATNQNRLHLISGITEFTVSELFNKFKIEKSDLAIDNKTGEIYGIHCNDQTVKKLRKSYPKSQFTLFIKPKPNFNQKGNYFALDQIENLKVFPKDPNVPNTTSNFERIQVPFKGKIVDFRKENIAYYRRIITAYEGHRLEEKKDGIFIDGKKTNTYKIQMNYYWLMGDNRDNSADSRVWGFVPEDHVVGKASLVWFSKSADANIGIRWERIFKLIE
jgi:signal peptidase I